MTKEELLKKEIDLLLLNKVTNFNLQNTLYNVDEIEIISKILIFNTFDLNMNNAKNWSEEFDARIQKFYYSTQKEMLARTLEKSIKGSLEQLSDRLTTPNLSQSEIVKFFDIIKSWKNISEEIIKRKERNFVSKRIKNIRNVLEKKPQLISYFKLKS